MWCARMSLLVIKSQCSKPICQIQPFNTATSKYIKMSNIANVDTLTKGPDLVRTGRDKFLCYKTLVSGFNNRIHDSWIVQFLCLVNFMTAWNASCMIVRNVFLVLLDGSNNV